MPLDQSDLPIILSVRGGSFFLGGLVPIPFLLGGPGGIVRPEALSITRPSRGSVVHTADSAFLDDFGHGVAQISLQGSTGYSESPLSGLPGIKALEALFNEYLARRQRTADAGGDPNSVVMDYLDVLNAQAFQVYPVEFAVDRRAKQGALLYYYRIRFWATRDYLHAPVLPGLPDFVTDWLGSVGGIGDRLGGITSAFSNVGGLLDGLF